jgi:hypothetical protein
MFAFIESGVITEYPIGLSQIRKKYPNTSFPKNLEGEDLSSFNVVEVIQTPIPSNYTDKQRIVEASPVLVEDVWAQSWEIIPLTEEELQLKQGEEESNARAYRNELLQSSDYTQLLDVPLTESEKESWATYRKALREISNQEGFPSTILWPTAPVS